MEYSVSIAVWLHYMDAIEKKIHGNKNTTSYIDQILEATPHETTAVRPPTYYL